MRYKKPVPRQLVRAALYGRLRSFVVALFPRGMRLSLGIPTQLAIFCIYGVYPLLGPIPPRFGGSLNVVWDEVAALLLGPYLFQIPPMGSDWLF